MEWRGFFNESKSYMSYNTMTAKKRRRFWLKMPVAWARFFLLSIGVMK